MVKCVEQTRRKCSSSRNVIVTNITKYSVLFFFQLDTTSFSLFRSSDRCNRCYYCCGKVITTVRNATSSVPPLTRSFIAKTGQDRLRSCISCYNDRSFYFSLKSSLFLPTVHPLVVVVTSSVVLLGITIYSHPLCPVEIDGQTYRQTRHIYSISFIKFLYVLPFPSIRSVLFNFLRIVLI